MIRVLWLSLFFRLMLQTSLAQSDDFTDGDDAGWKRLDLIGAAVGSPFASFQVQSGQYRLSCDPSPDPRLVGPARLGAIREDVSYSRFLIVVDVVSWDDAQDQAMGLLARVQPGAGPGAINGYSLNYQNQDHDLEINRLDGEQPSNLARIPLNLPPAEGCRLVFAGEGDRLTAAVYLLTDPLQPVASIVAFDSQYESGFNGVFAFDTNGSGSVDMTVDGYEAGTGEGVPVLDFSADDGQFGMVWPRLTGEWHLQTTTDFASWAPVLTEGGLFEGRLGFRAPTAGRRYYRLAEGWGVDP